MSITSLAWFSAVTATHQAQKDYFDFRVREAIGRVEQRMRAYEQVLLGVRGLYEASVSVERNEFGSYVASLRLADNYPGIQGVGFALVVPAAEKDRHLAAVRKQGFPGYSIRPEGQRDPYTSIVYLEPFADRNLRAFGYDMYAEPVRRAAMEYARDAGDTAMSGKVRLVQESGREEQAGFLMYVPVYRNGVPHVAVAERRANIVGWAYAPFRMNDLMAGIQGERANDLDIEIFDGKDATDGALMYDSDGSRAAGVVHPTPLQSSNAIAIAGHVWTINIAALPSLYGRLDKGRPTLIAVAGFVTSLLLAWLTWLLVTGRERAIVAAQEMNRDLLETEARFRLMADSAPVLIWIAGADKLGFWFNKVWLEFTGRAMEQELGNGWVEGVHPDDRQSLLDIYFDHFDRRQPFTAEYRLRRHDGAYRWVSDSGIPRFNTEGLFAGYIGSCIDITERKRAEAALQESEQKFRRQSQRLAEVIWGTNIGTWEWNVQTGETVFNARWAEIAGYTLDELAPLSIATWSKLAHPEDLKRSGELLERCFRRETETYECEARLRHKNGAWVWVADRGRVVEWTADGKPLRMSGTHQDITAYKEAEARLQLAASVFTHAREAIMITDAAGSIIDVNDTFTRVTGFAREESLGQNPRILKSGRQGQEFYAALWHDLVAKGYWAGEIWNRRKNGALFAEMLTISAVRDAAGKTQNYVALFTDITPMKEHQRELERIAHYDPLTGLPNRVLLADRLRQGIVQSQRRNQSVAVVYLDLDGFKAVNDQHGHDVGDELLIDIAQRMKAALREADTLARIGGDEFVAVLADLEQPHDCEPVLVRLLQAAADPVTVRRKILHVSASIGVTLCPQHGTDADLLLRHADQAMYRAKQAGKNRYQIFDATRDAAG